MSEFYTAHRSVNLLTASQTDYLKCTITYTSSISCTLITHAL